LTSIKTPTRVGAYVDGYNLFYGRLRGTAYKWLDIVGLVDDLLAERDQNETLVKLNLFTAHALARFAGHGTASVEAQTTYLRAMATRHGERFEAVFGAHTCDASGTLLPEYVAGQPFDRHRRVRVWRIEEKKTDINLALSLYRDCARWRYDRVVIVTNDSDFEPALRAVREDFPDIGIGVVMPIRPVVAGMPSHRRPCISLSETADWSLMTISDDQLASAQLPALVPTRKKPLRKPAHW
jgi:uncharacterized LabA/DUF88 family protein